MGLFSSSKPAAAKTTNKVWKTPQACLKGIVMESLRSIKNGEVPVIITFFNEAHGKLISFLDSSSVPYQLVEAFSGKDIWQQKAIIAVADAFASGGFVNNIPPEMKVSFFFLGRYPLLSTENAWVGNLAVRFPNAGISFCLSMEDPLFESFGSNSLKPLMEKLGMADDECIEHTMVNKALHNALEKIGQKVTTDMKANSERDWFARNAPIT